jgi:nucleotide-binding universal stress UspA family protein
VAALAAPGKAELHLAQVVKAVVPSLEEGIDEELNETKLQQANVYLADTEGRLLATMKELRLTITWSATLEPDVAATLVDMAEHGKHDTGGDDLIAISTHGRNGLSRWVMGSVTDRVLNVTRLPMLIVRPQQEKQG